MDGPKIGMYPHALNGLFLKETLMEPPSFQPDQPESHGGHTMSQCWYLMPAEPKPSTATCGERFWIVRRMWYLMYAYPRTTTNETVGVLSVVSPLTGDAAVAL